MTILTNLTDKQYDLEVKRMTSATTDELKFILDNNKYPPEVMVRVLHIFKGRGDDAKVLIVRREINRQRPALEGTVLGQQMKARQR